MNSNIKIKRKKNKTPLILRRSIIVLILFVILILLVFLLKNAFFNKTPKKVANESNTSSIESSCVSSQETNSTSPTDFTNWNSHCDWNLIVINSYNEISNDFNVCLSDNSDYKVDIRIDEYLKDMINAAAKDDITLWVASGFRDISLQTKLFNNQINKNINNGYNESEATSLAQKVVAKPRTSEHHTGLAVDLNSVDNDFYSTNEYKWLIKNSWKYGFILRYPENKVDITKVIFEPWHFRYVGKEAAKSIMDSGICLEEYINTLK